MRTADLSSRSAFRARIAAVPGNVWLISISLLVYAFFAQGIILQSGASPTFRIDLSPLLTAGLAIQVHVVAAIATFAIGVVLLTAPKGFGLHRTLGWTWVVCMAVTAGSSFFITAIFQTHYSPIHALSAWTMLGLPMGIAAVRRRDIAGHRKKMTGMFVGGMVVAGLFSLLPGRLMWTIFFAA